MLANFNVLLTLTSLQDVFKTYSRFRGVLQRRLATEGFAQVRLLKNLWSVFFTLLHLLVNAYRGVFRTWPNIYKGAFFAKILNGFKQLTNLAKNSSIADVPLG